MWELNTLIQESYKKLLLENNKSADPNNDTIIKRNHEHNLHKRE